MKDEKGRPRIECPDGMDPERFEAAIAEIRWGPRLPRVSWRIKPGGQQCAHDGCLEPEYVRGLCVKHYRQAYDKKRRDAVKRQRERWEKGKK